MGSQVTLTARTKLAAVRRRNHTTAAAQRRRIPGSTRGERRGNIAYEASGKGIALLSGFIAAELRQAVAAAQEPALLPILANYVAAMTETTCDMHGLPVPSWTRRTEALPEPVFGSALPSLRLDLMTRSPAPFRRRNIFINSSLGERA